MGYWDNGGTEIDKMTVRQWLDKMTDENWHSERCLVEAIIDGREKNIITAMLVLMLHYNYGYLPNEVGDLRRNLYKEMEEE